MLLTAISLSNCPTAVGKLRSATKHSGKQMLEKLRSSLFVYFI